MCTLNPFYGSDFQLNMMEGMTDGKKDYLLYHFLCIHNGYYREITTQEFVQNLLRASLKNRFGKKKQKRLLEMPFILSL